MIGVVSGYFGSITHVFLSFFSNFPYDFVIVLVCMSSQLYRLTRISGMVHLIIYQRTMDCSGEWLLFCVTFNTTQLQSWLSFRLVVCSEYRVKDIRWIDTHSGVAFSPSQGFNSSTEPICLGFSSFSHFLLSPPCCLCLPEPAFPSPNSQVNLIASQSLPFL